MSRCARYHQQRQQLEAAQTELEEAREATAEALQRESAVRQDGSARLEERLAATESALEDAQAKLARGQHERDNLVQQWQAFTDAIDAARSEAQRQRSRRLEELSHVRAATGGASGATNHRVLGVLTEEMLDHELRLIEELERLLAVKERSATPLYTQGDLGLVPRTPARTQLVDRPCDASDRPWTGNGSRHGTPSSRAPRPRHLQRPQSSGASGGERSASVGTRHRVSAVATTRLRTMGAAARKPTASTSCDLPRMRATLS